MKTKFVIFIMLNCIFCLGQNLPSSYQFKHLNTSDGLSQSSVIAIEQDNLGRMWLGTRDGLNLYDGNSFRVYRTVANDSTTISNSDILSIKQDSKGFIWIGTYNGLNKYDPIKDSFQRYYHFNDKTSLSNNTIWSIEELSNGDIWSGTSKGLSIYNEASNEFTNIYAHINDGENKLPSDYILSIKQDNNGTIWVGTSKGFCKVIPQDDETFTFQVFNPTTIEKELFVQVISVCDENTLCVGTKNMGMLKFDLISERFLPRDNRIQKEDVRAVTSAGNGTLWIGSSDGISILENDDLVKHIRYDAGNENSLSHNYVKSIFKDKKGSVWVGSYYGGVDIWDASNSNFINFKESSGENRIGHKVVSSIVDDTDGNLYIGTEGGGLTVFDRKTNNVKYISTENSDVLLSDNIKSLLVHDDKLWIGTFNKGVEVYDIKTKQFMSNVFTEELDALLSESGIYAITEGLGDDIWLGTFGHGLVKFDSKEGTYTVFEEDKDEKEGLSSDRIRSLMMDNGSNIWVGAQGGLNLLTYSDGGYSAKRLKRFFYDNETDSGDDILTIFQDNGGTIWVGIRAKGLFRFNGKTFSKVPLNTTRQITSIYAIQEDGNNTLWMSSNQGLLKYDEVDESFLIYTERDGLVGNEFSNGAALRQGSSKLYFGGPQGISFFDSKAIVSNKFNPQVLLTDLRIKNKSVLVDDENGILSQSLPFTKNIVLEHDKANFSIEFTMPNFINSASNQYQYRMVGLEDNWVTTDQTRANYTIQKPGDYVFEVKGANNDNLWNIEPTRLKIVVHAAPWFSNWAFVFYVILILASLLGIVNIIRSKTRLKHKLQLEHIANAQNQEINAAKLKFFTNVSHEFRTPLTLITGPLQQLLTDYKGSSVVYKKLLVIESNANHLLQLINRLMDFRKLQHKKFTLESAEGNLIKFLKEIFLSFSEFAKGNGYEYTFETEAEEILVYYDRPKLEQVFYNLISNAFKYTPVGGKINLTVKKNKDHVIIEVCDSGPGIPYEYQDKVFERFFEIPDYIKGDAVQNTGTGIGLSIAKSIIELHKGDISVLSDSKNGSTFRVSLQLGKAHIADHEIIENFKFSDDIGLYTSQLSSTTNDLLLSSDQLLMDKDRDVVLIVEDNLPLRNFMKDLLKDIYNVIEAGDGREALQKALKYVPTLIVSDVIMPFMVGTELCAKIKENIKTSHIPVILLTSRTSLLYKFEGLESGADDYISKPFNIKEFKLRIKNLIDANKRLRAKFGEEQRYTPNEIVISSIDEQLLKKALKIVEDNISNDQFDIITFSTELGVSRTLLFTKIKAWTNFTPNEFIQEIRMKRAVQLLEQGNLNISEIGYQVGFKNPKYFSKCFNKKFGLSPTAYISKFSEKFFDLN